MSEPRMPRDEHADDGELLSAYLDGDLDPDAEAALEARLGRDGDLAARLESTRQAIEALSSLRAAPPPGYHDSLRARIASERERRAPGPVPAAAAGITRPPRGPRAATGPGRPGGRSRRVPALTAAAGVVVLALLGGVAVLGGLGGQDEDVALDEPALGRADAQGEGEEAQLFADDAAPETGAEADDEAAMDTAEEAPAGDGDAGVSAAPGAAEPVLLEDGAVLEDGDAARAHFASRAALAGVLGLPADSAEDVARAFRVAVQRAEPFATGVHPDHCLDEVTAGASGPAVPVLVEAVTFEGREALAYLVVTATSGSDTLDRLEGWVVDPDACATRLFTSVAP